MKNEGLITRKVKWFGVEYTLTELKSFASLNSEDNIQLILEDIRKQEVRFIFPESKS